VAEYVAFFQNHPVLVLAFVGLAGALAYTFVAGAGARGVARVGPTEATRLINQEDAVVVDVRGDGEFHQGHIINAVHLPLQQLAEQLGRLERHRQRPLITVCRTGQQSLRAAAILRKHGFERIYHLRGGIVAWEGANLPLTRK